MSWAEAKIARFERFRARLLNGRTEEEHLAQADRVGPYLTLLRGLAFERENVRWIRQAWDILDQRTSIPAE
ncbi:hypothetical protein NE236_37925 [Actinoallomurus purpureus]|uniref:hypothetical protein n=1 Tax=Actinoallomurus purpureus TaxID=478114 RepID=UPI0020926635|nr:hypothetical protein [Actinoallomurus purpureus]MCO6010754.1 hypothetical protein [Actinoallomurus purpureus]